MEIKKILNNSKGFTLIELLVVIALIGTLSVFTTSILISIYQSNQTVTAVNNVKQNSDYILSQLEYAIRNAKSAEIDPNGSLKLTNRDNILTTFSPNGFRLLKDGTAINSNSVEISNIYFELNNLKTAVKVTMGIRPAGTDKSIAFRTIILTRNY
ncbi:MAG: prepilin-type N-terminal cleavage/methylation domain-containing protein [Patescibacteria group bacterium]|nr:prepilin-type N-terminal cleavage/methylation domain-containing protein [Patescibacteria group bacterium]